METVEELLKQRVEAVKKLPRSPKMIIGSLVVLHRLCGKAGCRCLKGYKHRALYLSRSRKGKTTTTYVPASYEKAVRRGIALYKRLLTAAEGLSELNLTLMKERGKI